MPIVTHLVRENSEFQKLPNFSFSLLLLASHTSVPVVQTESDYLAFSPFKCNLDLFCIHVKNVLWDSPCHDIYCNTGPSTCLLTPGTHLGKGTNTLQRCQEGGGRAQLSPRAQHEGGLEDENTVFAWKTETSDG